MTSLTALSVIYCIPTRVCSLPACHDPIAIPRMLPCTVSFPSKPCSHFVLPPHTLVLLSFPSPTPRFSLPCNLSHRPRSLTVGLASLSVSSGLRVAPLLTRLPVLSLLSWPPYYIDVRFRSPSLGGQYALLAPCRVLLVSHFPFIVHRSSSSLFHQLPKLLSPSSSNMSVPLLSAP
jgi:hypothetical protein